MFKSMGKKSVHVQVRADLHDTLRRLCIDTGLSATEIVTQYLQYLHVQHYKKREPLNAKSHSDFKLDARTP